MTFTTEQITKAKQAKSAEELLEMAKASGIEMTEDEAKKYFAELHKEGELSDDELDAVAGGDKGDPPTFNGYEMRSSRWATCDQFFLVGYGDKRCGNCKYFYTVPKEYQIDKLDGYCTTPHN